MLDNVGAASPAAELSSKLVSAVGAVTNAPRLTQRHEYRKQLNFTRVYSPSCEITGVEWTEQKTVAAVTNHTTPRAILPHELLRESHMTRLVFILNSLPLTPSSLTPLIPP